MKWVLLAIIAVVVLILFRRLSREQRISAGPQGAPSTPALGGSGLPEPWATRPPMTFDEFYRKYYADADLENASVFKTLEFVAKAGGVPSETIRPEDRIEDFPRKNLARTTRFVEKLLTGPLSRLGQTQGLDPLTFHVETVDDLIRHMDVHKDIAATHLRHDGEPTKGDKEWH